MVANSDLVVRDEKRLKTGENLRLRVLSGGRVWVLGEEMGSTVVVDGVDSARSATRPAEPEELFEALGLDVGALVALSKTDELLSAVVDGGKMGRSVLVVVVLVVVVVVVEEVIRTGDGDSVSKALPPELLLVLDDTSNITGNIDSLIQLGETVVLIGSVCGDDLTTAIESSRKVTATMMELRDAIGD